MSSFIFLFFLATLGAGVGSFIAANAGRVIDRRSGLVRSSRFSNCDTCNRRLKWFELIPVVSYVLQFGKCRSCRAKISKEGFFLELVSGVIFVLLGYIFLVQDDFSLISNLRFILILVVSSIFIAASFFDAKTLKVPNSLFVPLLFFAFFYFLLGVISSDDFFVEIINFLLALIPISGVYWIIYLISRGRMVGMADVKFGIIVASILPSWRMTAAVLFLANVIALIYYPLSRKGNRRRGVVAMVPAFGLAVLAVYFCWAFGLFE